MRKTLYKHCAYLRLYCSSVSHLLSRPAPRGISQYTGSQLFSRPARHWTASLKKTREPGNILRVAPEGEGEATRVVLFQTFALLAEKKDLGDLQPNKGSKWSPVL